MHDRPHQPEAPRDDRQAPGARASERAFAVDRVGAERNRSPIRPFLAVGVLLIAIASLAWIGRPPTGDPSRAASSAVPTPTPPRNPADSPILGGNLPDREHGTDGLLGGLVFPPED